jgi:hypothetical protein
MELVAVVVALLKIMMKMQIIEVQHTAKVAVVQ